MYKAFYGLKEKPFSSLPDPAYFYPSKQHETATSLLEHSLANKAGFCVLSGQAGLGKTTLLRRLLERMAGDEVAIGLITNTHASFGELLYWILHAFDLADDNKLRAQQYKIFIDYLIGRYARNQRTLLIIDEAQNLTPSAWEELRMLTNINSEKDLLLQVVLVGQPSLREVLQRSELEQFAQRVTADYHLEALGLEATRGYIRHRLAVAGGEKDIFTDDACDAVFNRCHGIPRLINQLCDFALVYAYAERAAVVTEELIEKVASEREMHAGLPVFSSEQLRGQNNSAEKKISVPANMPPGNVVHDRIRKSINPPPAQATLSRPVHARIVSTAKTKEVSRSFRRSTDAVASSITATETRPSPSATESKMVVTAPYSSMITAESLVENPKILKQVNGIGLLAVADTISESSPPPVGLEKFRARPDPSDKLLEQKRNILWGTFNQDEKDAPPETDDVAQLLSEQKRRVETAEKHHSTGAKRLDWLADLPSRDSVQHPLRRWVPGMFVLGLFLLGGLAWSVLRPAPSSDAQNVSLNNAPRQPAAAANAKSKKSEQRFDKTGLLRKPGVRSAPHQSVSNPVISARDRRLDVKVKRQQAKRAVAPASPPSKQRALPVSPQAAGARENILTAEQAAGLVEGRESKNQWAHAAETDALTRQKRPEPDRLPRAATSDVGGTSRNVGAEVEEGESSSGSSLFW